MFFHIVDSTSFRFFFSRLFFVFSLAAAGVVVILSKVCQKYINVRFMKLNLVDEVTATIEIEWKK